MTVSTKPAAWIEYNTKRREVIEAYKKTVTQGEAVANPRFPREAVETDSPEKIEQLTAWLKKINEEYSLDVDFDQVELVDADGEVEKGKKGWFWWCVLALLVLIPAIFLGYFVKEEWIRKETGGKVAAPASAAPANLKAGTKTSKSSTKPSTAPTVKSVVTTPSTPAVSTSDVMSKEEAVKELDAIRADILKRTEDAARAAEARKAKK